MKVSVIDLGFNSLKMVNYHVGQDSSSIQVYDEFGVMARLGDGLNETGFLAPAAIRRTIDALKLCRDVVNLESIRHVIPIGTSPLREAGNRDEFLRQAFRETGFRIRVLSPKEEALYSFLGAIRSTGSKTSLFFDLGGGSLEVVYAEGFKIRKVLSLPMGVLRLTQLYADNDGNFSKKRYAKMRKRILQLLPDRRELGLKDETILVGVGGTVRALARYEQQATRYPFNKVHNFAIRLGSVEAMTRRFYKMGVSELEKVDSIGSDRASTMVAGSAVVRLLMKKLGLKRLVVSTHGLRDGILATSIVDQNHVSCRRGRGGVEAQIERSLKTIVMTPPPFHKTIHFLSALSRNGGLDTIESWILANSVRYVLAEDYDLPPEVLFYSLIYEDSVMSHRHQLMQALSLVRSKKTRTSNWFLGRYARLLEPEDKQSIRKIASCLKLLEILERASSKVRVETDRRGLRLRIYPSKDGFPEAMLRSAINQVEDYLGVSISLSLARHEVRPPVLRMIEA